MSNRPTRRPSASTRVREAQRAAEKSRTVWIFAAVGGLIAVVAVAVLIAGNASKDSSGGGSSPSGGTIVPSGDLAYGSLDVTGDALPKYQATATATATGTATGTTADPAVGQAMPGLRGETFDASPITISADGKPKLVMFVAHWCPHCQKEVPRIQDWLDQNGMPADVELFAVATGTSDSKPNYPPGSWLRGVKWSVPTMLDDKNSSAAQAYGLSGYPYFVVVGADGKVVERTSGELTTEQFQALLDDARRGKASTDLGGGASSSATPGTPTSTPSTSTSTPATSP